MAGRATLTTVASSATTPEPSTVATRIQRPGAVAKRTPGLLRPFTPSPVVIRRQRYERGRAMRAVDSRAPRERRAREGRRPVNLAVDVSAQQRCGVVRVGGELDLATAG